MGVVDSEDHPLFPLARPSFRWDGVVLVTWRVLSECRGPAVSVLGGPTISRGVSGDEEALVGSPMCSSSEDSGKHPIRPMKALGE